MEIKIEDCGHCPFQCDGYCKLSSHGDNGRCLYVKNEWREDKLAENCPLKKCNYVFGVNERT